MKHVTICGCPSLTSRSIWSVSEHGEWWFTTATSRASFAETVEDREGQTSQTEPLGRPLLQQKTLDRWCPIWRSWKSPLAGKCRRKAFRKPWEVVRVGAESPGRGLCSVILAFSRLLWPQTSHLYKDAQVKAKVSVELPSFLLFHVCGYFACSCGYACTWVCMALRD